MPGPWDRAQIKIWPTGADAKWPPELTLDDAALQLFADRWGTLTP